MWNWSAPEVNSKETLSLWARSKAGVSQMFEELSEEQQSWDLMVRAQN